MRGAAGGRQPTVAKPPWSTIIFIIFPTVYYYMSSYPVIFWYPADTLPAMDNAAAVTPHLGSRGHRRPGGQRSPCPQRP